MSSSLYAKVEAALAEMLSEQAAGQKVKLSYAALAKRAGVSLSTVNLPAYQPLRARLKAAKPQPLQVATHEDAVEWRRRYHQLQTEKAASEQELRERLRESEETVARLLQRLQVTAVQESLQDSLH